MSIQAREAVSREGVGRVELQSLVRRMLEGAAVMWGLTDPRAVVEGYAETLDAVALAIEFEIDGINSRSMECGHA